MTFPTVSKVPSARNLQPTMALLQSNQVGHAPQSSRPRRGDSLPSEFRQADSHLEPIAQFMPPPCDHVPLLRHSGQSRPPGNGSLGIRVHFGAAAAAVKFTPLLCRSTREPGIAVAVFGVASPHSKFHSRDPQTHREAAFRPGALRVDSLCQLHECCGKVAHADHGPQY